MTYLPTSACSSNIVPTYFPDDDSSIHSSGHFVTGSEDISLYLSFQLMKFVVTSILVSFHVLFLKCCCGGWIDPDTPHDAKQITSLGTERTYVFTSIHLK